MRYSLACLLTATAMLVVSGCGSHAATVDSGLPPTSELPMYGGVVPNSEQQAINAKFVHDAIALKGSPQAASDEAVKLGFDYLLKSHDPATAMKRFNQAYLLDPDNGADYQGMAITLLVRNPTAGASAEGLFKRGIDSKRVNPDVFADYGRFLLMQKRPAEAVSVLQKGVALDANYVETGSLLARAYYENDQKPLACPLAKRWLPTAQHSLIPALSEVMADPVCKSV